MRYVILALLAALVGSPAAALSCLAPDPVRMYVEARDSERLFSIVLGVVTLLETPSEPGPLTGSGPANGVLGRVPATVDGMALTREGFTTPFSGPVTVEIGCAGPWCGGAPAQGERMVMSLEYEGETPVLRMGACGGRTFEATVETVEKIEACHAGATCEPDDGF